MKKSMTLSPDTNRALVLKFLAWLAAAVLFALFAWGSASLQLRQERAEVTGHAAASITAMQEQDELHLRQTIREAEQEVRFFAGTPPVAGIGRALLNNGLDPVDGNTLAQWRARLEQIGQSYATARPEVFQLRLIGVADGGRELVRVVQDHAGKVTVVGADGLQQKGNTAYFRAAVGLPEGAVHVSPIDLNVEHDRIELPHRPTLRAAMPVRNDRGEVFAVVVVNVLAQPLLDVVGGASGLPDVQEWVTDAAGHYLWHPQPGKAFAHLLNPPGTTWQEEFTPAPDAERPAGLPPDADAGVLRAPDGADWLIFTKILRAPAADGTGGVVLHSGIPLQALAARAWEGVAGQVILVWAMGLLVFGLGTLLLLRWERLTRLESAVAAAADDSAKRRAWHMGAGVAVVVLLMGGGVWGLVRGQMVADAREDSLFRARLVGQRLTTSLRSATDAARVLAELRPDTMSSQAAFQRVAEDLNNVTTDSLVLQWAPQAIVRFSQPLAGNEPAIGLDLRADPRVRDLIESTIQSGESSWDGPFPLLQGGIGMVYRVPVYRSGAPVSEQNFLGLATCLVNFSQVAGNAATLLRDYDFEVSVQSGGAAPLVILPAVPGADAASAATAEVSYVPEPSDILAATVTFKVTAALSDSLIGYAPWALAPVSLMAALLGGLAHMMETRRAGRRRLLQLSIRLERSAHAAKVGFWEIDYATGKVNWSAEMFEFRGITKGEFDGTLEGGQRFTHPEDRERLAATMRDARPGEPFIIEFRVVRPDGQIRWLEARGVLQTDASGQPVRFVGTETDITTRRLAEAALRESEAKFRDLWESSRDAQVLCFPPDWRFVQGNSAAVALYGSRDPEHLAQCTPKELTPEVQPDGTLSSDKTSHYLGLALREGRAQFECIHQRIDGTPIPTEISLNRITIDGVTGVQATIRDISARKESERDLLRFKSMLDNTTEAVFLFDPESLSLAYTNRSLCATSGYSLQEMPALHVWELLPRLPEEEMRNFLLPLRDGTVPSTRFESVLRRRDRADIACEIFIQLIPFEGERPLFLAILSDITARKAERERTDLLHGLIESIAEAIILIRKKDECVHYTNAALLRLLGLRPKDVAGKSFADLGIDFSGEQLSSIYRVLDKAHGGRIVLHTKALRSGVMEFDAEIALSLIDLDGETYIAGVVSDISSRLRDERSMASQAGLLNSVVAQAGHALIICDAAWKVQLINLKASELLGWKKEDVRGRVLPDFREHEGGNERKPGDFTRTLAEALGQKDHSVLRGWWRPSSGKDFYGDLFIDVLRNEAGEIVTHILSPTDRTEMKVLADREGLQRMILNHAGEGIYTFSSDGIITLINPEASRMLGYTAEETLGQLHASHWIDPASLPPAAGQPPPGASNGEDPLIAALTAGLEKKATQWKEVTCIRKDGSKFPAELTLSSLREGGGFLVLMRDVSREKAAEEMVLRANERLEKAVAERTGQLQESRDEARRLLQESKIASEQIRKLVENDADAVIIIDDKHLVRFANPAAESLLGRTQAQLQGTELGLPLGGAQGADVDIRRRDGTLRVAELRSSALMWDKQPHTAIYLHDITERSQHAAELRAAKDEAVLADHAKSDFLAAISHELRTPLTSICGFSKTIKDDPDLPPELREEFIGTIFDQSMRLTRLVGQLLDLSSVRSGQATFDSEDLDLVKIARRSIKELTFAAGEKSVEIVLETPKPSIAFLGDPVRLQSLMTNLLGNAVKFSPPGGTVAMTFNLPSGGIAFSVQDEGPGIPEEALSAIFDKFHRVQRPSNFVEGTGLGLPITKAIAQYYGGTVEVQSVVGKGSTFMVFLPQNKPGGQPAKN